MNFKLTDEMKAKLKNCKTAEDLLDVAREYNLDIDADMVKKSMPSSGRPLLPEELGAVYGGCSWCPEDWCPEILECESHTAPC